MTESDFKVIKSKKFKAPPEKIMGKAPGLRRGHLFIFLSITVLLSAVIFLFQSRAVSFKITPHDASVKIVKEFFTPKLGNTYLLKPGRYEIHASEPGYKPLSYQFEVTDETKQMHFLDLEETPGLINLDISDGENPIEKAKIYIGEELKGYTPMRLEEVPAGSQKLEIRHPLFKNYSETIEVIGKGEIQKLEIVLEPAWALISIASSPSKADIFSETIKVGNTPATFKLGQGEKTIRLSLAGYASKELNIKVVANQDMVLDLVNLEPNKGMLQITSVPDKANVSIGGIYRGQSPLVVPLKPQSYDVRTTKAGYETSTAEAVINSDETTQLSVRLNPLYGKIELLNLPKEATVYLDEELYQGSGDSLKLLAKPYRLKVVLAGHLPYEKQVIPNPLATQEVNVLMQTVEEAKKKETPRKIFTSLGNSLIRIDPGKFKMGANRRQPGRRANEIEKTVQITRPYYLGVKEISNQDFLKFAPSHNSGVFGRVFLNDPETPAVNISWENAVMFCNWLSDRDGIDRAYVKKNGAWRLKNSDAFGYRLPTEAEWAWAARESEAANQIFQWGGGMPPPNNYGNFADRSAKNVFGNIIQGYDDTYRGPAPSGSFPPNKLGIFDLAGNVSEWINDIYSTQVTTSVLIDPTSAERGNYRVIRGSNYMQGSYSNLRLTYRDYGVEARPYVGFRIARHFK